MVSFDLVNILLWVCYQWNQSKKALKQATVDPEIMFWPHPSSPTFCFRPVRPTQPSYLSLWLIVYFHPFLLLFMLFSGSMVSLQSLSWILFKVPGWIPVPTHRTPPHPTPVLMKSLPAELIIHFLFHSHSTLSTYLSLPGIRVSCAGMTFPLGFSHYPVVWTMSPHLWWPLTCHSRGIINCCWEEEWMNGWERTKYYLDFLNGVFSSDLTFSISSSPHTLAMGSPEAFLPTFCDMSLE